MFNTKKRITKIFIGFHLNEIIYIHDNNCYDKPKDYFSNELNLAGETFLNDDPMFRIILDEVKCWRNIGSTHRYTGEAIYRLIGPTESGYCLIFTDNGE